jgi:4-amino-4-deoxy-L-arabinose transferase-like glycosyltransferase
LSTNERPASSHDQNRDRRLLGPGLAFLGCGITFLGVGMATKMFVFAMLAPAFIALGVVFLARARPRPGDGQR